MLILAITASYAVAHLVETVIVDFCFDWVGLVHFLNLVVLRVFYPPHVFFSIGISDKNTESTNDVIERLTGKNGSNAEETELQQ